MNPGIAAYAALAYLCWGLFPLYFKQLSEVPALEALALYRLEGLWNVRRTAPALL
jgi:EamA domain-containing membrane protein RarD